MLQIDRRSFLAGGVATAGVSAIYPAWAQPVSAGIGPAIPTVSGPDVALTIGKVALRVDGKVARGVGINGTVPGPLVRLKEGHNVRLRVTNALTEEETSIHWHGVLVPFAMDGVPGVSFPGIPPRSSFVYEYPVVQSGTYWYHSKIQLRTCEPWPRRRKPIKRRRSASSRRC